MNTLNVAATSVASVPNVRAKMNKKPSLISAILFFGLMLGGILYTGYSLVADVKDVTDLNNTVENATTLLPFLLLGVALLIALGFEFVNGFHDTARGGYDHDWCRG